MAVTAADRIYWSTWGSKKIQGMDKSLGDVRGRYTGGTEEHYARIGYVGVPITMQGRSVPGFCVLAPLSFRCLH